MKYAIRAIVAAVLVAPGFLPDMAQAKSVKWSCVNVDPANPSSFVCTVSGSRP